MERYRADVNASKGWQVDAGEIWGLWGMHVSFSLLLCPLLSLDEIISGQGA